MICITILMVSRFFTYYVLDVSPKIEYLLGHWQHLKLTDLRDDLAGSLINLHSQPPLWNSIIGISSKACNTEPGCVLKLIHLSQIAETLIIFGLLYSLSIKLFKNKLISALIALSFCLSPSVFLYENYIFYPHLTAMFFLIFSMGLHNWYHSEKLSSLIVAGFSLVLLSYTWALFHPVFLAVIFIFIYINSKKWKPTTFCILTVFFIFSTLPSIKNEIRFDFFGSGSWLGFNLAQIAPHGLKGCGFNDFILANDLEGEHSGTAFNPHFPSEPDIPCPVMGILL